MVASWHSFLFLFISSMFHSSPCQFVELSTAISLSNNAKVACGLNNAYKWQYCSIHSWLSSEQNTTAFMITFMDGKKNNAITSDIISFSPPPSYSYYYQSIIEICNASVSTGIWQFLTDVVQDSTSMVVLGAYYDSFEHDAWFVVFRITDNYKHKHDLQQLQLNPSPPSDYIPSITATKLFNTDTFIISYHNKDHIYYYLLNKTSETPISSTATSLHLASALHLPELMLTGLTVRASLVSERYLMVWEGNGTDIHATMRRNDGTVFRSEFLINILPSTGKQRFRDLMALNISDTHGLFAVLYSDTSNAENETLHICMLDDFGSHLKNEFDSNGINIDVVFFSNDKMGHPIQSAAFTELDITELNMKYITVTFAYNDDTSVYIQLFQFAWNDGYTNYHLHKVDNPFQISSSTNNPCAVCISSVSNQILVAWLNKDEKKTNIQLFSTDIHISDGDTVTKIPTTTSIGVTTDTTHTPRATDNIFGSTDVILALISIGICVICLSFGVMCVFKKHQAAAHETTDDRKTQLINISQRKASKTFVPFIENNNGDHDDYIDNESAKTRLAEEMEKYMTAIQNNTVIDDIDIQQVLDDYHLLLPHVEAESVDEPQPFAGNCTESNCIIFRRHYRDTSATIQMEEVFTPTYCSRLHILDKVHCFSQHSTAIRAMYQKEKPHIDEVDTVSSTNIIAEWRKRMNNKYQQLHVTDENDKKSIHFRMGIQVYRQ
eukprot:877779_1